MPTYHQNYWMGLTAASPQRFSFIDITMPSLAAGGTYRNWGRVKSPAGGTEPDNAIPLELCAVGNWTERQGVPESWGWADTDCLNEFVSICRVQGALP